MNSALGLSFPILFVLGVPIAVSIGLASIIGIEAQGRLPLLLVAQRMFTGIDSFPVMAIPLFILAGNLMSAGGISQRLVELAKSLVGGVQGGLACTCVLTCMLFASISGSSVATTFPIGAILIPAMVKHSYPKPLAASIQASSAEFGVLIPPSISLSYGVDPVHFGQIVVANLALGMITPPLGGEPVCRLRCGRVAGREDHPAVGVVCADCFCRPYGDHLCSRDHAVAGGIVFWRINDVD